MSTTIEAKTEHTPEDLLAMPDGKSFELVDGELVERNVSRLSSLVAMNLGHRLVAHCAANQSGWNLGPDCGYQCFAQEPRQVRRADVSFVRRDRMPAEQLADPGFVRIAPDLAIEVVSPNDLAYEVEEKVRQYLAAGVRQVWVIYPTARRAYIHRAAGSLSVLSAADELSGEDVLPGFQCRLDEILPAPLDTAPIR